MADTPLGEVIERLRPDEGHDAFSCPECRANFKRVAWLNHEAILAALQAGQAMVAEGIFDSIICCPFCDAVIPYHLDDCKWAALVAAYRKE